MRKQKSPEKRKLAMPLVATKLRPPANRSRLIERPQLLEVLRQTLNCKLALIHGPAGFGKTTVAVQWFEELRAAGTGVAWLAIDVADNDLNRFLSYLVEAVRLAEPRVGNGLLEVIESNPGTAANYVLDSLVNDFVEYDREFVLFLDDWHLIDAAPVGDALRRLIARMPPRFHVVVTSRSRSRLPLARMRVRDELVEIDSTALRFDLEESRQYLSGSRPGEMPAEDVTALWETTEGWAAALHLAALSLRRDGRREQIGRWSVATTHDIGEYLAENVLDNLPEDQVAFLVRTSVLDRLCGDLCAALTGDPDSATRLAEVEQQELFLLPLDEERRWFRYHHLFQQYLQRRLKRQQPELVEELHRAAAHWFADHGDTADAVAHAIAGGDQSMALQLVERDAMVLVEHSQMSTLLNLVSKLPRTRLFEGARLQMAIAWANTLTHRPQESEVALWHVERIAEGEAGEARKRLVGEANVVRACSLVYADETLEVERMVRPCLDKPSEFQPWTVGVAANILAYRHLHTTRFEKVGPLLLWARDYQDSAQGPFSAVYGRCFHGIAQHRQGEFEQARRSYQEALDIACNTSGPRSNAARLSSALLGQLLYEFNELEEADRLLRASRTLGLEGGVVDFYLATYLSSCRLLMLRGAPAAAMEMLQEGEDVARQLSLHRFLVGMLCERARVRIALGDIRGAEEALADVEARRERTAEIDGYEGDEVASYVHFARARLLLARGAHAQARSLVNARLESARRSGWKHLEFRARILIALILESQERQAEAEQMLVEVINEAVPAGMVRTFLDEGERLVGILRRLREQKRRQGRAATAGVPQGELTSAARRLLEMALDTSTGVPGLAQQSAVANFTQRESDVLRLVNDGLTNKEIARSLDVSVDTVKWHLKNVFTKLGVATRTQAVSECARLRLFVDS